VPWINNGFDVPTTDVASLTNLGDAVEHINLWWLVLVDRRVDDTILQFHAFDQYRKAAYFKFEDVIGA
jgi:hypothetical protein